jgi:hypothetical protein
MALPLLHVPQVATFDAPNEGTCMVGFNVEIAPSMKSRFVVQLTPGEALVESPVIREIQDW